MAPATPPRSQSPAQRPLPSSPTYSYASTLPLASTFTLPPPPAPHPPHSILMKSDLEASQIAYSELLTTAKNYRLALAGLSSSASAFGGALEACARLKEARGNCTGDNLMSASGVHQLIANHQQILSECVYRSFEVPLLHELDNWRRHIEEEEVAYQKEVKNRSKEIRKMEREGLRLHKQRKRDVRGFRGHLVELTGKLDGLTTLHGEHARGLLRDCQEVSMKVVESSSSLVRAEVDIFEALARKGWTGGGLEELLERGQDLFSTEPSSPNPEISSSPSKIFSILPQKSILVDSIHSLNDQSANIGHKRSDSLLVDNDHYQSLNAVKERDADSGSPFSERDTRILNRSRGVRPFSPEPVDRNFDPLELPPPIQRSTSREEQIERFRLDAMGSITPEIFRDRSISAPSVTESQTKAEKGIASRDDASEAEKDRDDRSEISEGTVRGDDYALSSAGDLDEHTDESSDTDSLTV
ncbi:hypothetical protein ACMFMG_007254 [Clarireedia jacksonii]